ADWAGCPVTRCSTSGYCVFLGDNLLSWSAKRQVTLSRSSAEAEYRGVANVVAETAWIGNLLLELHAPLTTATLVYCDNVSAVYLTTNHVQHQRTKHIEIDIHFVRDYVASGQVMDAKFVNDFRPISLIGCVYKVNTKVLANRLASVIADLVSDTQSAFVAGRQILDYPFILKEILHWCKRKKKHAMFFKVDFAKAYDSVRWDYLLDVLEAFGFGSIWCKWIRGTFSFAKASILVICA
ncbi:RNA-directed DNA polymerase, eukaryota, partial [Tanacetum coccineum]